MFFSPALRALLSCFGSNNNNSNCNSNRGPVNPSTISGPRCFTHLETGDESIPLRAFVSTPPPYVQPERR
ncbi:hypothetical protein E4T44_14606, partial [Aureobasidium sp. EXF-8845]